MAIFMTADNDVGRSKERKILQRGKEKSKNVQTFKNSFIIHKLNYLSTTYLCAKIRHVPVF